MVTAEFSRIAPDVKLGKMSVFMLSSTFMVVRLMMKAKLAPLSKYRKVFVLGSVSKSPAIPLSAKV